MNDIFTVFRFTLRDNIRKKAFLISTIIVIVAILAGCTILGLTSGKNDKSQAPAVSAAEGQTAAEAQKNSTCYVIDDAGLIPDFRETLSVSYPDVNFIFGKETDLQQYKETIEKDKTVSAIEVSAGQTMPMLRFYATDFMSGLPTDGIAKIARSLYVSAALSQAGVSQDVAQLAVSDIPYDMVQVGKMDLSGYVLGIVLTMIIFFAVYYYGYGVAMSVASEKTSRVMETLIVSSKPSRILLGKCLAMGVLGLLQLTLFLLVGAASYSTLVPSDFTIGGMPLALSSFTVQSALLVLVYFLLGYSLYAMINSVCGASVSRAEDLHAAMMPAILISLVSFYAAYICMFMPGANLKRIMTYIPFTSPFIMPFRLLNETVSAGDILISIALLIAAIILVAIVSVRLYSASVLHYGQRLKIKDMFKLQA